MPAAFESTQAQEAPYTAALADQDCRHELLGICRDRSALISTLTVGAILMSFFVGLLLIVAGPWMVSAFGAILYSWSMVAAWYLVHDCSHRLVYVSRFSNQLLGEILSAMTGNLYFSFTYYCRDHNRHHIEKVDIVGVDIHDLLWKSNKYVKSFLLALEWAYIPAVYFYVKLHYIGEILLQASVAERSRCVLSLLFYAGFGLAFFTISPLILLWTALAVAVRIHVIRCIDAFQHSFEELDDDQPLQARGDNNFEQLHTYSFPVSTKIPWLNMLVLNFGFHNAHHALPSCPWYHLPRLDRAISRFQVQYSQETGIPAYLPIQAMFGPYHRHRVSRILTSGQGSPRDSKGRFDLTQFTGAFTDNLLG